MICVIKKPEGNPEQKTLIIYTNCQRIISTDDTSIRAKEFQEIKKEHKES